MRTRVAWVVAGVGVAAAAASRLFRRTSAAEPSRAAETVEDESDERADELRRRIEESKPLVEERDEFEAGETPLDEADPETRRRAVHARGRDALEDMRRGEQSAEPQQQP